MDSSIVVSVVFDKDGFWKQFSIEGGPVQINATLSDGTTTKLFSYYPDEVSFTEDELIGLTVRQARDLFREKDLEWLRTPE